MLAKEIRSLVIISRLKLENMNETDELGQFPHERLEDDRRKTNQNQNSMSKLPVTTETQQRIKVIECCDMVEWWLTEEISSPGHKMPSELESVPRELESIACGTTVLFFCRESRVTKNCFS